MRDFEWLVSMSAACKGFEDWKRGLKIIGDLFYEQVNASNIDFFWRWKIGKQDRLTGTRTMALIG